MQFSVKPLPTPVFGKPFCSSPNGDENFVENKALLNYSNLSEGTEAVKPSSMAVSEFHFLLLVGNKVKVCLQRPFLLHLYLSQYPCLQNEHYILDYI